MKLDIDGFCSIKQKYEGVIVNSNDVEDEVTENGLIMKLTSKHSWSTRTSDEIVFLDLGIVYTSSFFSFMVIYLISFVSLCLCTILSNVIIQ